MNRSRQIFRAETVELLCHREQRELWVDRDCRQHLPAKLSGTFLIDRQNSAQCDGEFLIDRQNSAQCDGESRLPRVGCGRSLALP